MGGRDGGMQGWSRRACSGAVAARARSTIGNGAESDDRGPPELPVTGRGNSTGDMGILLVPVRRVGDVT